MPIDIRLLEPSDHAAFVAPLRVAFGMAFDPERIARTVRLGELDERIAACDGEAIVGSAGAYALTMTVPGGAVPVSGLTMVGVMTTHRRRGVLTTMIRTHFARARAARRPISALWASEPAIYGRFGYGVASRCGAISIERARAAFMRSLPDVGELRLVGEEEALERFPPIWDRLRAVTPGMMSRTREWWEVRRIGDHEKGAPLQRLLFSVDGQPEGYALYRFANRLDAVGVAEGNVQVVEAIGVTPRATARVWRYLFDVDLARRIDASLMPPDHPVVYLRRSPLPLAAHRLVSGDLLRATRAARASAQGARIRLNG
jgi:predicted acetyltransferase